MKRKKNVSDKTKFAKFKKMNKRRIFQFFFFTQAIYFKYSSKYTS